MAQLNDTFNARLVDDLAYQAMMAANHGTSIEGAKSSSKVSITIALAVMMLVVCGLVWALISSIGRPITRLTNTMRQLAEGKLHTEVAGTERHDEIGGMAQAVQVFKDAGLEKIRLESDMEAARHRAEEERRHREMERDAAAREQENIVNSLAIGLAKLAEGDLVFRLNTPFGADYEKLRNDFNNAMNQMHETMKVILNNASNIRAGTGEIAEAADDLSRRTEQQAASLEQTAAALDEITATVRRTAEGASHAHEVVASTQSDAERSGGVVRDAVAAMSEIETSSQQISNIIGVIDEIAFQTNLLALNAGVEAARAGDAGRGFAVVASEVRALAQRSADAAKEIKSLISASTRQVVSGVDLVGQTGTALARIVSQIGEISGVVSQIAASAQEQATGLHQVNAAINQMDQVTQQNAAMVEESTAACHSLAQETEKLVTLTARFQIGEAPATAHNVAHAPTRKREPQKRFNGVLKPVLAAAGDFANSMDMEEF
ncbi:MAG: HAMP domain-containing protein [Rhodospirillales bacterium]|nr:HAMP domain-containing protein [Rhodospirillales bacterium]